MAKAKRKKSPIGGFKVPPGKCRIVKGAVRVCVARNGDITYSAGKRRKKAAKKTSAPKKAPAKKRGGRKAVKGVKLATGKILRATKHAPSGKSLRKVPKGKALRKRVAACKSETFNVPRKSGEARCSCVLVTRRNRLSVATLKSTACPNRPSLRAKDAVRTVRQGRMLKGRGSKGGSGVTTAPIISITGLKRRRKGRKSRKSRR